MRHGQFAVQLLPNLVPTVQVSQCNLSPQVHRLSGFKPLEALTDVGLGLRPVLRCPALGPTCSDIACFIIIICPKKLVPNASHSCGFTSGPCKGMANFPKNYNFDALATLLDKRACADII